MTKAWVLALWIALSASAVPASEIDIPSVLEPWQAWVLHGDEAQRCPARIGAPFEDAAARICAWPGALAIDVTASEARFRQRWTVYAENWVILPGSGEYWPDAIRVDGRPAAVLDRAGQPAVRLEPGEHEVTGRIPWQQRPAALPVPAASVLFDLMIDGRRIDEPERTLSDGRASLWLGERPATVEESRVDLRVHRRLEDGIPGRLETRLMLAVSGPAREITLGPVLPADYRVTRVASDLPVRLEADQRLRLQLRRGSWRVTVTARAPGVVDAIALPVADAPWPPRETLSFAPSDALRIVTVDGAAPTDPAQAGVPAEWHGLVAYVLAPGDQLALIERSRGLAGDAATRLALERDLWLDFDHSGWLARDRLRGQLSGRWRLEMARPWQLESATSDGVHLSVTHLDGEDSGIELRNARIDLDALASLPVSSESMPASGWQHDLDAATTTLHLPPGHRLIAAFGVAESVGDWLGEWTLLDIFVALLVTVSAFRLLGIVGAVVALPALALAYHEPLAPTWLWVNLVLAVALVRALPHGRLRQWAGVWRSISFALMLVALLPFAFLQLRVALFPQLGVPVDGAIEVPVMLESRAPAPPVAKDAAVVETVTMTAQDGLEQPRQGVTDVARPASAREIGYLPGTIVQTGPARPAWQYQDYVLRFAAPLQPGQTLRLVIAPPWATSALRVLSVALAVLLLLLLAGGVARTRPQPGSSGAAPVVGGAIMLLVTAMFAASPVRAQSQLPTPELLRELERRLLEPPPCTPECVSLAAASVTLRDREIVVALDLHAEAATAFPIPQPADAVVDSVADASGRRVPLVGDPAGQGWILVEPGVHALALVLPTGNRSELRLRFPRIPKRIVVNAPGWSVGGIAEGRLIGDTVTLQRAAGVTVGADETAGASAVSVQPFVRVERIVTLDLDWVVTTRVQRLAPESGGLSVDLPLLPGEAVTEAGAGVAIDGRTARVSLQADQQTNGWHSTLARDGVIELEAATDASWTEVWHIAAGPNWHLEMAGTPEVGGPVGNERRFAPRPGEHLRIEITRPEPITGESLVIDSVSAEHRFGPQATATQIGYRYRSTQGGRQLLRLPADSTLEELRVDGQVIPLRLEQDVIALPVEPGEHTVLLRAQTPTPVSWRIATPSIDLGAPAGNVTTRVDLPANRWILWAQGTGVGPAILYWSELVAFLLLAVLVGRLPQSPLRTHEWLLLGLGLSTFSWWVLLVFAGWVFAMRWRERAQLDDPLTFNLVQVMLGIFAIVALVALVSAIPNGLLGTPDMRIAGPGSQGTVLGWFDDRTIGELPAKSVLNVSIWWYKIAMLAWALWLSFALVRWVPWGWRAYCTGGYWRERQRKAPRSH